MKQVNEKIRLDKYVASQLGISRTDAKRMLRSGYVTVNGAVCKAGEKLLSIADDTVECNGKKISYKKYSYIMLNKPKGVVSASRSPEDRTVVDLVPEELKRKGLFPAGRLDKDSTGFVLITDDGEFAHSVLSPTRHVPKTYLVTAVSALSEDSLARFESGVELSDGVTKAARISLKNHDGLGRAVYTVTLTEGRYHQIKRMFAALGSGVAELHRVRFGGLELDKSLLPGECRELLPEELALIDKKATIQ